MLSILHEKKARYRTRRGLTALGVCIGRELTKMVKKKWLMFGVAVLGLGCYRADPKPTHEGTGTDPDSTDTGSGLTGIDYSKDVVQVIGGYSSTCLLKNDGSLNCWGKNAFGLASPPNELFQQVNMGSSTACGVTTTGRIRCWGQNKESPEGTFVQVTVGAEHVCALREDGGIVCWGDNSHNQTNAPDGTFTQISGRRHVTCGLRTDSTLLCWGENPGPVNPADENYKGPVAPPSGEFVQVTLGDNHGCGLRPGGTAVCWGENYFGPLTPPADTFGYISAGDYFTCGLTVTGDVRCWGGDDITPPEALDGQFQSIAAGSQHACAIGANGKIVCWGEDRSGECTVPGTPYTQITRSMPCGLKGDGTVDCLGISPTAMPLGDRFHSIAVGAHHLGVCGAKVDGGGRCWGDYANDLVYCFPEDMDVMQLAIQTHRVFALTSEGTLAVCTADELSYPEEGVFTQISGGHLHVCGIREDGTVVCWGLSDDDVPPPEGTFYQVSSGGYSASRGGAGCDSCGVRTDGSIACWGYNELRPLPPPEEGSYRQVSVGDGCVCGLRTDSTVACWGEACSLDEYSSASDVPEALFTQVASGGTYACGLRTDGQLVCWGSIIR